MKSEADKEELAVNTLELKSLLLVDDDERRARDGLLGLQLHAGAPMKIAFRNIRLQGADSLTTATRADSIEKVWRSGRALAGFSPAMDDGVAELKRLMRDLLYRHYRVSRMSEKAGRVLTQQQQAAWQCLQEAMEEGWDIGAEPLDRDALHER